MSGRRLVVIVVIVAVLALGAFGYVALGGPMPAFGPWSYVASENSMKYHDPSCPWAEQIRSRRFFSSQEAAEEAGRIPCPVCIPEAE